MKYELKNEEIRVLGCLIEKEMATPEYYPLSMNALVNACNQKSNRDPVVAWTEEDVFLAIENLKEKQLVWQSNLSRVPKYEERFIKVTNFIPEEAAVLCILMLRGPQTAGEIRGRTERLHAFESLDDVNDTLENLISLNHVVRLPRQPGRKEVRYYHLLSPAEDLSGKKEEETEAAKSIAEDSGETDVYQNRIIALEAKTDDLRKELEDLKNLFAEFKRQFD
jgi:hypothetical protein